MTLAEQTLRTNNSIRTRRLGRRINWSRPPKATAIVQWRHQGRAYKASFRSACHMARLNNLARAKYGTEIVVIQPCFNAGIRKSAGTHDFDATWDVHIPGVDWWEQQRFFRANGFACWYRRPPLFGPHIHGFTLPPREGRSISDDFRAAGFLVGRYVDGGYSTLGRLANSSQLSDYYAHAHGLSGGHDPRSDNSWFPREIERTIFDLDSFVLKRVRDAQHAERLRSAPKV